MNRNDWNDLTDAGDKVEMICCGMCRASFKSRMELYHHFHNQHSISQEFRGYNALTSKKSNNSVTAPTQIQTGIAIQSAPTKAVPTRNTVTMTIDVNLPISSGTNLSHFQFQPQNRFVASTQQRDNRTFARNVTCPTPTTANDHPEMPLIELITNKPTTTLHYYPTNEDLNRGIGK